MTPTKSVPDAPADPSSARGARAMPRRKPPVSDRATRRDLDRTAWRGTHSRRRPLDQRLLLVLIGLALVLLALGGWAGQALRLAR
jgi:hypothetical protein